MAIRETLAAELTAAMRRRDTAAVSALRTAISAVANAESVPAPVTTSSPAGQHIAGATSGVGATEVARVTLTDDQVRAIVAREWGDCRAHAERLGQLGRRDEAHAASRGADALSAALRSSEPLEPGA